MELDSAVSDPHEEDDGHGTGRCWGVGCALKLISRYLLCHSYHIRSARRSIEQQDLAQFLLLVIPKRLSWDLIRFSTESSMKLPSQLERTL